MARNIVMEFKVKYKNWLYDPKYQIEEKNGKYIIHRVGYCFNVAEVLNLNEMAIRSALDKSKDLDAEILNIMF